MRDSSYWNQQIRAELQNIYTDSFDMARNPSANEDILYKCTIDEIRLRVISDLQEKLQDVHEYS